MFYFCSHSAKRVNWSLAQGWRSNGIVNGDCESISYRDLPPVRISLVFQAFTQQFTCGPASILITSLRTPRTVSSSLSEGSPMSAYPTQKPVCVVVGVGPGNGAAFARRFAAEGYAVALLARTTGLMSGLAKELPVARAYACDAGDPAAVERTFASIESDLGSVVIYNAGKGVWGSAEEVTLEDFEAAWRTNTFGAFAAARSVGRRQDCRICFRQGGPAQSCRIPRPFARPSGIIIDGIVDEPSIRAKLAGKPDSFFVKPDDIADTAVMLIRQKPSAWTFELEARPFGETW
jgi:hypothetical protein